MTDEGLRFVAMALAIGLGAIGPGAGIGVVFSGALQAMGRNPEAEGMLRTYMFLGFCVGRSAVHFVVGVRSVDWLQYYLVSMCQCD